MVGARQISVRQVKLIVSEENDAKIENSTASRAFVHAAEVEKKI
jgi:hypothetical protein